MNAQKYFLGFSCAGSTVMFDCESKVCPGGRNLQRLSLCLTGRPGTPSTAWGVWWACDGGRKIPLGMWHKEPQSQSPGHSYRSLTWVCSQSHPEPTFLATVDGAEAIKGVLCWGMAHTAWGWSELWDMGHPKPWSSSSEMGVSVVTPSSGWPNLTSQPRSLAGGELSSCHGSKARGWLQPFKRASMVPRGFNPSLSEQRRWERQSSHPVLIVGEDLLPWCCSSAASSIPLLPLIPAVGKFGSAPKRNKQIFHDAQSWESPFPHGNISKQWWQN